MKVMLSLSWSKPLQETSLPREGLVCLGMSKSSPFKEALLKKGRLAMIEEMGQSFSCKQVKYFMNHLSRILSHHLRSPLTKITKEVCIKWEGHELRDSRTQKNTRTKTITNQQHQLRSDCQMCWPRTAQEYKKQLEVTNFQDDIFFRKSIKFERQLLQALRVSEQAIYLQRTSDVSTPLLLSRRRGLRGLPNQRRTIQAKTDKPHHKKFEDRCQPYKSR